MTADAKLALTALLPRLRPATDRSFLEKYQKGMASWRADMAALQDASRDPIAPQYLMGCVDEQATDDAILTCDSGTIATWAARHWTIRGDRDFYLSDNLATMAPGLPYAIAMQHAFPGRQVIAFVGDGGFAMLVAEFLTAVRHELPIKVVINNNNSYGQIRWKQIILGYPEYAVRHRQPEADFSAWARSCGAYGVKVTRPGDVAAAVREALAHPGPALVDCDVNPDEPPMPGKIEYQQAKSSPRHSCAASRTRSPPWPPSPATRSTNCGPDNAAQLRRHRPHRYPRGRRQAADGDSDLTGIGWIYGAGRRSRVVRDLLAPKVVTRLAAVCRTAGGGC